MGETGLGVNVSMGEKVLVETIVLVSVEAGGIVGRAGAGVNKLQAIKTAINTAKKKIRLSMIPSQINTKQGYKTEFAI